jgi:hypothetical protein
LVISAICSADCAIPTTGIKNPSAAVAQSKFFFILITQFSFRTCSDPQMRPARNGHYYRWRVTPKNNTLIIEGTNSQATDAAGEFITSEESMESFRNRIPSKQVSYFEILLKTTRLNNTPFKAELITYRIY